MRPAARDQVLDAIRRFQANHGQLPMRQEWEYAARDRPCARTIERRWGWQALLTEAVGAKPGEPERRKSLTDYRAGRMLAAFIEARDELGRWPFAAEWERAGGSRRGGRS